MTTARLTPAGLNARLVEHDRRIAVLELAREKSSAEHQAFQLADAALQHADGETARAVDELTKAIKDPETGLIVGLREFRTEVRNDRRVQRAYIAGVVAIMSVIFTLIIAFAPLIQQFLGLCNVHC